MPIERPRVALTTEAQMDLRRLPSRELEVISRILKEPLPTKVDPEEHTVAVGKGWLGRVVDRPEPSDTDLINFAGTPEPDSRRRLIIVYRPVSENTFRVVRVMDENAIQKLPEGFLSK
jgi:hypothetical protein